MCLTYSEDLKVATQNITSSHNSNQLSGSINNRHANEMVIVKNINHGKNIGIFVTDTGFGVMISPAVTSASLRPFRTAFNRSNSETIPIKRSESSMMGQTQILPSSERRQIPPSHLYFQIGLLLP